MEIEQADPVLANMDKRIREQAQEILRLRGELDAAKRDAMNWETTANALAQRRNELQSEYQGMSHAMRIMTEVLVAAAQD